MLIIGKINASSTIGYWRINDQIVKNISPGDFAIVQNKSNYDLVTILGIVKTEEEYIKSFVPGGANKNVIYILKKSELESYNLEII